MRLHDKLRRSFRPALETCEVRSLLSVAAPVMHAAPTSQVQALVTRQQAIEPLQFGTTITSGPLAGTTYLGTLRLRTDGKGNLAGTLQDVKGVIPITGDVLPGGRIALRLKVGPNQFVRALGAVLSGRLSDGRLTLEARGDVQTGTGSRAPVVGSFGITGSDSAVVRPNGTVSEGPAVAVGARFQPMGFSATVRRGPDSGVSLAGVLNLGPVGRGGSVAGTLQDAKLGAIPVTGRLVGSMVRLRFNLGARGVLEGAGPFVARRSAVGESVLAVTALGTLSGLHPGNSGDWDVSPLSFQDLSYRRFPGFYAPPGTTFVGTKFYGADLTGAYLPAATILNSNFVLSSLRNANLTGAALIDDDMSNADLTGASLRNTAFMGTTLNGANLTNANLTGADLTGAVLINVRWQGAVIDGVVNMAPSARTIWSIVNGHGAGGDFSNTDLRYAYLANADLHGARLTSSRLVGASLAYANLQRAVMTLADLSDASLQQTNLSNAYMVDVNLRGANLTGANLRGADMSGVHLEGANLAGADLTGADVYSLRLNGANLRGSKIDGVVHLDNNLAAYWRMQNVGGAGLQLSQFYLTDADLRNVNLAGARLSDFSLVKPVLKGADLTGSTLKDGNLDNVDFRGAAMTRVTMTRNQASGVILRGMNLQNAAVTGNFMDGSDFSGADLRGARLTGNNFQNANFSGANLSGADLSTAILIGANFTGANLTGANLTRASILHTNFDGANLNGTNFSDTLPPR